MFKNRFQKLGGFRVLLPAGALLAAAACGDDEAGFEDATTGGAGGSAGWTTVPSAGTPSSGGANGTSGSSSVSGSGGSAGKAGASGSSGSGGTSTNPPITFDCAGLVPDQAVITSFDGFLGDLWSSPGNLNGGVYVYPEPLMLAAGEFLGFDAEVSDYTGFGAWFAGCFDASKFDGIRFTVSGSVGASASVQFYAVTNQDRNVDEPNSVGSCVPDDENNPWLNCRPPVVTLAVTGEAKQHSIPFSAFAGGLPTPGTDGSDLLALQWSFDWIDVNSSTPYAAELTIDNLEFYVANDGGGGEGGASGGPGESGGAGGQGGAPSAGVAPL